MKKSFFYIALCLTLMFAAFTCGIYVGRNMHTSDTIIDLPAATTAGTTQHVSTNTSPSPAASDPSTVFPLDINLATAEELDLLPDIGAARAKAIVAYREEFGPFTCTEDLMYVPGIGEKIFAKIRDLICVGG